MTTIGDLFKLEADVMEFYDDLLAAFHQGDASADLRGAAFAMVMGYRTIQVELINLMARARGIPLAALPLNFALPLSPEEQRVGLVMAGTFTLHKVELRKKLASIDQAQLSGEEIDGVLSITRTLERAATVNGKAGG